DGAAIDHAARAALSVFGARGDVGGGGDLTLVSHDEHAVAGRDDVRFDRIDALGDRQLVRAPSVLRQVPRGAAVADDGDHRRSVRAWRAYPRIYSRGIVTGGYA